MQLKCSRKMNKFPFGEELCGGMYSCESVIDDTNEKGKEILYWVCSNCGNVKTTKRRKK